MPSSLVVLLLAAAAAPPMPSAEGGALAAQERELQALFERVQPSVVLVSRPGGVGSGFFVAPGGLALTSAHVVGDASRVDVFLPDGRRFEAQVAERASGGADLALLQVPVTGVPALALATLDDVRVGSFVACVGHGEGAIWTFNTGLVSNIYPAGAERPVIQTQVPLRPGSSGAPLVDRRGRVVGIVTAGLREASAINFALRADAALRALDRLAPLGDVLVVRTPAEGTVVLVDGSAVGMGTRVAVPVAPGEHEVMGVVRGKLVRRRVVFPAVRTVELSDRP